MDVWVKFKYDVIILIGFFYWYDGSLYGMNVGELFIVKIYWKGLFINLCFVWFFYGKCLDLFLWMFVGVFCEFSIVSKVDSF